MANIWTKESHTVEERLEAIEKNLRDLGWVPLRSGETDRWDLEIKGGVFGAARLLLGLEQHGSGRQLLRIHSWPRYSAIASGFALFFAGLAAAAAGDDALAVATALGATALLIAARIAQECAAATAAFLTVVRKIEREEKLNLR